MVIAPFRCSLGFFYPASIIQLFGVSLSLMVEPAYASSTSAHFSLFNVYQVKCKLRFITGKNRLNFEVPAKFFFMSYLASMSYPAETPTVM